MSTLMHVYRIEAADGKGPMSLPYSHDLRTALASVWGNKTTHPGLMTDFPTDRLNHAQVCSHVCATPREGFKHWWPRQACRIAYAAGLQLVRYTMPTGGVVHGLSGHQVFIKPQLAVDRHVLADGATHAH